MVYYDSTFQLPTQNMWAYSMFPIGMSSSIMSPQDSLSNLNDKALFQFNFDANTMLNQTAMTNQLVDKWAQQFNARLAEWYKNMMLNLSSNTKIGSTTGAGCSCGCGGAGQAGGAAGAGGVGDKNEMPDSLVWQFLKARLGGLQTYGEKFREKVTLKDGTQETYVNRISELCKDYVTAESPELSDAEFATCKAAAEKIKKTGALEKADYLALKAIADAHLGKAEGDDDDGDNDAGNDGKQKGKIARSEYYTEGHYDTAGTNETIAQQYLDAFNGMFTSGDNWKAAGKSVEANNVIEILESFEDNNDYGEDWISAVLDDVSDWKGSNSWFMDDDKAWPIVKPVYNSLTKRANDLQALQNCDSTTKKSLAEATKNLKKVIDTLNNKTANQDLTDDEKTNLINSFNNLVQTIKEAETKLYVERS